MSSELKLSIRQVRTAFSKLISTGEITLDTTNKYTVVSVCNYNIYQPEEDDQTTNKRQTRDKQTTNKRQTNDKQTTTDNKNNKNNKNNNKENNMPKNEFSEDKGQNSLNKNSKNYLSILEDLFKEEYLKSRGFEYKTATKLKDKKAFGKIAQYYKENNPTHNTEQAINGMQSFFADCMNIEDKFIRENISPMFIVSQITKINTIIKSSNNSTELDDYAIIENYFFKNNSENKIEEECPI